MLIDTHAHLNFAAFKDDAPKVIRRSLDSDVWVINVGSQYSTSKRAADMAEKYDKGVYAAVGLHPIYAEERFNYEKFRELVLSAVEGKVVAIGEIGLDYKTEYVSFKERQKEVLQEQINLAKELKLPIIFHCRMSHDDLIKILFENGSRTGGVVHCFTGTWKQAKDYMAMGLYLGFNGIIFKPAPYRTESSGAGMDLDNVIEKTPLEKILLETDCPYLTPPSETGRNEPIYVKYVAEKIAEIKNLSYEEISEKTCQNAKNLFKI